LNSELLLSLHGIAGLFLNDSLLRWFRAPWRRWWRRRRGGGRTRPCSGRWARAWPWI